MSNETLVIAGFFYFSKSRRRKMDLQDKARLFCKLLKDDSVREYTEVVTVDDLVENPKVGPVDRDAVYIGEGFYYGRKTR